MTAAATRVRSVLDTPRGHRFSKSPALNVMTREQRLLRQMASNPRVAYRTEHGVLPLWMHVAEERRKQAESLAKAARASENEAPPSPRRGRHRAPRRRRGRSPLVYGVVLAMGAVIGQVVGLPL